MTKKQLVKLAQEKMATKLVEIRDNLDDNNWQQLSVVATQMAILDSYIVAVNKGIHIDKITHQIVCNLVN